ncbi:hypothetical protein [Anthocerotibacter panamensis]|nr:hypothetical protein [Anthocerotibacter panamensis]
MKIPFLSLAPISGALFIIGSVVVLALANIYAKYPLLHPLVP